MQDGLKEQYNELKHLYEGVGVDLPIDIEIMKHKFYEKNGWGEAFTG